MSALPLLAAALPGAHRFLPVHIHVWNSLPLELLIVLIVLAVISYFLALFSGALGGLWFALAFAFSAWLVPFAILTPRHTETRHQAQILMVGAPSQRLWINAQRLPDGVWWPDEAQRPGQSH
jgi:hypothetical protein